MTSAGGIVAVSSDGADEGEEGAECAADEEGGWSTATGRSAPSRGCAASATSGCPILAMRDRMSDGFFAGSSSVTGAEASASLLSGVNASTAISGSLGGMSTAFEEASCGALKQKIMAMIGVITVIIC